MAAKAECTARHLQQVKLVQKKNGPTMRKQRGRFSNMSNVSRSLEIPDFSHRYNWLLKFAFFLIKDILSHSM